MRTEARVILLMGLLACGDSTGPEPNALPVLVSLSPSAVVTGSGPVTVTVTGQGFIGSTKIRIDGVERPTTVASALQASTPLTTADLSARRILSVVVENPEPGGGISGALQVLVTDPAPVIDSVVPGGLLVGGPPATIAIYGQHFRPGSVVRWSGTDRPTRFSSTERLEADLTSTDRAVAVRVRLDVVNPPLEGGATTLEYPVFNEQPSILGLAPRQASRGGTGFMLTVTGEGFVPGSVIRWNGAPRPTTFQHAGLLTAAIPPSDLGLPGAIEITVANPDPALAVSAGSVFQVQPVHILELLARDLAWDPVRKRLYASVAPNDGQFPNEVVAVDPSTGQVVARVSPGLEPGRLAISDDASVLYVGLNGEPAVARIDLATFTRNLRFQLGTGTFGPLWAQDIEVLPGSPGTVAVSRVTPDFSPHHDGVALYDNGVRRPMATGRLVGGNLIEFSSATTLYGWNNETTGFQLYRMDVTASGLSVRDATDGLIEWFHNDIRYGSGYIFSSLGAVVDAATARLAATLPVEGLVCPEPGGGRVFYVTHTTVYSISTSSWTLIGSEPVPAGAPPSWYSVTRWGPNGLAYIGPTQIVIYQSELVGR